jgi:hypothetical protein
MTGYVCETILPLFKELQDPEKMHGRRLPYTSFLSHSDTVFTIFHCVVMGTQMSNIIKISTCVCQFHDRKEGTLL